MATYIQLGQAAQEVGKSEITVRRLIKANKISHRKETTLTGFIYLVDPEEILRFYGSEQGKVVDAEEAEQKTGDQPEPEPKKEAEPVTARQIRVAVTGESGNLSEYWQKRAETFEERYYQELTKQSKLHEELGVWRGRAEQAQNMVVKLLSAPEDPKPEPTVPAKEENGLPFWLLTAVLAVSSLVVVIGGVVAYLTLNR